MINSLLEKGIAVRSLSDVIFEKPTSKDLIVSNSHGQRALTPGYTCPFLPSPFSQAPKEPEAVH